MAIFIKNNAKPNILHVGSKGYDRALEVPTDLKGRPMELTQRAEEKIALIKKLSADKKLGDKLEIPVDVHPFAFGMRKSIKNEQGIQTIDESNVRKYSGIKMGEIVEFKVVEDGIEIMKLYGFCDEVAELDVEILDKEDKGTGKFKKEWKIIKKNREGTPYHELKTPEETEELIKQAEALHREQMKLKGVIV